MIELGLGRVQCLLAKTPLPWRAVHVAGTNGKGSVCAYVSAMLECYNNSALRSKTGRSRIRHARFTSPHLIDRWDCITIDGRTVSKPVFDEVEAAVLQRNNVAKVGASEFELLTATAFEIFTRHNIDVGVIEVGMGGRLDATNVIGEQDSEVERAAPLAVGITSIGLDHQQFLGNTLEEIATEKCGIIKTGVPVVAARQSTDGVDEIIADTAAKKGCGHVTFLSPSAAAADIWQMNNTCKGPDRELSTAPIQARWANGAVAAQLAWHAIRGLGRLEDLSESLQAELLTNLCQVPARTVWAGRLQDIDLEPLLKSPAAAVLDGAHNADSAHLLRAHLDSQKKTSGVDWLLAFSEGKDVKGMLDILLRAGDSVTAVEFGPVAGMPWVKPMRSEAVIDAARSVRLQRHLPAGRREDAALERGLQTALEHVFSGQEEKRHAVIAGSLYLVGDVLRLLRDA